MCIHVRGCMRAFHLSNIILWIQYQALLGQAFLIPLKFIKWVSLKLVRGVKCFSGISTGLRYMVWNHCQWAFENFSHSSMRSMAHPNEIYNLWRKKIFGWHQIWANWHLKAFKYWFSASQNQISLTPKNVSDVFLKRRVKGSHAKVTFFYVKRHFFLSLINESLFAESDAVDSRLNVFFYIFGWEMSQKMFTLAFTSRLYNKHRTQKWLL